MLQSENRWRSLATCHRENEEREEARERSLLFVLVVQAVKTKAVAVASAWLSCEFVVVMLYHTYKYVANLDLYVVSGTFCRK